MNIQYIVSMAGVAGFEPTNDGVRVRCLTAWRHPNIGFYAAFAYSLYIQLAKITSVFNCEFKF